MKYSVTAEYDATEGESHDVTLGRLMAAGLTEIDLAELIEPLSNRERPEPGSKGRRKPETHTIEVSDDPPPATSEERYCDDPECPVTGDHLAHAVAP